MLVSATVSESSNAIIFSNKVRHSKGTCRSPGSSVGCKSSQPVKWNDALLKDPLDMILEAFVLYTKNTCGLLLFGRDACDETVNCQAF